MNSDCQFLTIPIWLWWPKPFCLWAVRLYCWYKRRTGRVCYIKYSNIQKIWVILCLNSFTEMVLFLGNDLFTVFAHSCRTLQLLKVYDRSDIPSLDKALLFEGVMVCLWSKTVLPLDKGSFYLFFKSGSCIFM